MITATRTTYFDHFAKHGTDKGFEPQEVEDIDWQPTQALPGSFAKIDVLAERLEAGLPLWHEHDRVDYRSLSKLFVPK